MAKTMLLTTSPFAAWIRNGEKYQSFDIQGNEVRPKNGPIGSTVPKEDDTKIEASGAKRWCRSGREP